MKNTLLTILSCFLAVTSAKGLERNDSIKVLFRQGHAEVDSLIPGNRRMLENMDSIFNSPFIKPNRITIVGTASPEGPVTLNYSLSDNRAENILKRIPDSFEREGLEVAVNFVGRDWKELYQLAQEDTQLPFQEETLSLLKEINSILDSENRTERESDHFLEKLKSLKGGTPYSYMYHNLFPLLRASNIYLSYSFPPKADLTIYGPELTPAAVIDVPALTFNNYIVEREPKNFYMALKTNMLYDVLALPSLSAEFYLGKNFSAVANWTYGWWDKDRTHRYWRAYGGDLAVRWWFGKKANIKPLTGHHIGLYGGILTYDFEFGGKGYMGGLPHETLWNRSLRMAGIEYGYSLPISRRINIDFTIGIGYLGGKYIKYIPDGGRYLWQSTHKINWFGPTKAEISLVWLIGNGNFNSSKKGGSK